MKVYTQNVQNFTELSKVILDDKIGIAPYTVSGYEVYVSDTGDYLIKREPQSKESYTVEIDTPNPELIPLLDIILDSGILLFHNSFASEVQGVEFACIMYRNEVGMFTHAHIILDYDKGLAKCL